MMKNVKKRITALIKEAEQDKEIVAVGLFGSAARHENSDDSDIDISLFLRDRYYTPIEFSQKKMEYLKLFDFDIKIFQQLPLYIRIRILKEMEILFCSDENELYEIAFRFIREFSDFEPIYRHYLREVASD